MLLFKSAGNGTGSTTTTSTFIKELNREKMPQKTLTTSMLMSDIVLKTAA